MTRCVLARGFTFLANVALVIDLVLISTLKATAVVAVMCIIGYRSLQLLR